MKPQRFVLPMILICTLALAAEEVPPEKTHACFPGAYYRKAVSSQDIWTGIEGIVTLPSATFDPTRRDLARGKYLDNPSIYIGGRAGDQEIDCGVTWEVIKETDGSTSTIGKAFRPFWRNKKWNTAPAAPENYFYPGDTIRLSLRTTQHDKLTMRIELLARAGVVPATQPAQPLTMFDITFDAPGFGVDRVQEFKRVNAIDQKGNEGKPVTPTKTSVEAATWKEVWLWRNEARLPFIPARYTDMRCPDASHFDIQPGETESGEVIAIRGTAE